MLMKFVRIDKKSESGACPHCLRLRSLKGNRTDWSEYGGPRVAELKYIDRHSRDIDQFPHHVSLHLSNGEGFYTIKLYHMEEREDGVSEWIRGYEQGTYRDPWARFGEGRG
jgi:hypothetical protein